MAFNNVRRHNLGNGLSYVFGDFTHTQGASNQTFAVGAGRVLQCDINPQATAEPVDVRNLYSVSISSGIATLTIYAHAGISAGTFCLLVDAGG